MYIISQPSYSEKMINNYTYGAVIVARNDNYGGNLPERATYAFNSILNSIDELIYVDWASEGERTLIDEIRNSLALPHKLKVVVVSPQKAQEYIIANTNPQGVIPQTVTEVLGRNIGLRRLGTEFMISTNVDVIFPPRELLEKLSEVDTFSPVAKRMISLEHVRSCGGMLDDVQRELVRRIEKNEEPFCLPGYGPQGPTSVCEGDVWTLVNGNGDFQIAHRDIWYGIRGFEESLIGRGYADGNVQKKALTSGWKIAGRWDVPVFHIGHDGGSSGGGGGTGGWNDVNFAMRDFDTTTNPETWGFSDDTSLVLVGV